MVVVPCSLLTTVAAVARLAVSNLQAPLLVHVHIAVCCMARGIVARVQLREGKRISAHTRSCCCR